jgi:regulator of chromosome condensation
MTKVSDVGGGFSDDDEFLTQPRPIKTLVEEDFRAVKIAAGDSISAALSDKGELKVWGSFFVSI